MTKKILLLFISFLAFISIHSQSQQTPEKRSFLGSIPVAFGLQKTVGDFSSTHSIGISADWDPAPVIARLPKKNGLIGFTYYGGMSYYFGKKETVSGYPYKYPGYFLVQAFGGLFFRQKKLHVNLLAGPALGIHDQTRFNICGRVESSYPVSKRFYIGPLLNCTWEPGTQMLWSAGIKFHF